MDLNKVADAERYLAALDTDYKNWQASKATVGELLQLVREGSKEVGELNKTKERLEGEIKALEQQLKNGLEGNERVHQANLANYQQAERQARAAVEAADARVIRANDTIHEAEKAVVAATAKQQLADAKLLAVERKIEEAQELLGRLTKVGA